LPDEVDMREMEEDIEMSGPEEVEELPVGDPEARKRERGAELKSSHLLWLMLVKLLKTTEREKELLSNLQRLVLVQRKEMTMRRSNDNKVIEGQWEEDLSSNDRMISHCPSLYLSFPCDR